MSLELIVRIGSIRNILTGKLGKWHESIYFEEQHFVMEHQESADSRKGLRATCAKKGMGAMDRHLDKYVFGDIAA